MDHTVYERRDSPSEDGSRSARSPRLCGDIRWDECIESDVLVDVNEWAEEAGRPRIAVFRCALTASLWDALRAGRAERGTFDSFEQRVRSVVGSAATALARMVEKEPPDPARARPRRMRFAAAAGLRSRGSHSILRLRVDDVGTPDMTVVIGGPLAAV